MKRRLWILPLLLTILIPLIVLNYSSRNIRDLTNRYVFKLPKLSEYPFRRQCQLETMDSLCSCDSNDRGFHQNVIAYSLYSIADDEAYHRYVLPLLDNIQRVPLLYPGWIVRIYHNMTSDNEIFVNLTQTFSQFDYVDMCNATAVMENLNYSNLFPMTWRFLPIMDPTVDLFVNRDSDSPLLQREVDAVHDWIESNYTHHIMRDHPYHCIAIVGGMWGAKVYQTRQLLHDVGHNMFTIPHKQKKGFDQDLLGKYIWPIAVKDCLAHDSYCCGPSTVPYPSKRQEVNNTLLFVNMNERCAKLNVTCPEKCRPKEHPDWIYC